MVKYNSVKLILVTSTLLAISACAQSTSSPEDKKQTMSTDTKQKQEMGKAVSSTPVKKQTDKTTDTSKTKEASKTQLSKAEADDKLDQVARIQYGEEVTVNNKPSETHLYEESHYKQTLYKQILGVWQGVKDKNQLKQMGLNDEQIKNSKVEIGFLPDHDMQMRTIGLPAPEETPFIKNYKNGVTIMTGRYIIKDKEIVIYFGRDAMENQTITINKDVLTLAPISDKNFKLNYKKVNDWSLDK